MPKLSKADAKKVEETEGGSFEPIPPGVYHVRLLDVEQRGPGPSGAPYWSWSFEVAGGDHSKRRLWNNTSLSEAAAFKLKEAFAAFGVDPDTDTDDLVGKVVKAVVSQRTIQAGDKQGQITNQIDRLEPADEDFEDNDSSDGEVDLF